jgi:hypothetical protein
LDENLLTEMMTRKLLNFNAIVNARQSANTNFMRQRLEPTGFSVIQSLPTGFTNNSNDYCMGGCTDGWGRSITGPRLEKKKLLVGKADGSRAIVAARVLLR